jgi:hypothetical protein
MELTQTMLMRVKEPNAPDDAQVVELSDIQLAFVGGGIADVVAG